MSLKDEFLRLLETDKEFRYAILGFLGIEEILKAIRSLQEQVVDNSKAIRALQEQVEQHSKVLSEHSRAIRSLQEAVEQHSRVLSEHSRILSEHSKAIMSLQEAVMEHSKVISEHSKVLSEHSRAIRSLQEVVKEHSKVLSEHSRRIEVLTRLVHALGARWGLMAEDAFRSGMKGLVERYFGGRVERWVYDDVEGFVFGRPCVVEVDLVVKDMGHVLVEVKSSISKADVSKLLRIGQLYEKVRLVKPKLAVVSPYIDDDAKKFAEELGIETYTALEG
ncbi:MAG: PD-(D/E)XK nuclease family protein [Candidatus Bathyarchaeota archaeon]